jgi:hypothetical protein
MGVVSLYRNTQKKTLSMDDGFNFRSCVNRMMSREKCRIPAKRLIFSLLFSGECAENRAWCKCLKGACNVPGRVTSGYFKQFISETRIFGILNVVSYITSLICLS